MKMSGLFSPLSDSPEKIGYNREQNHRMMLRESVAIVGMGCRLPGANNLNDFWQLLRNGIDAITEVPGDRHTGLTGWGGFLAEIDGFDAEFFGIPDQEAVIMDPQQRFLLEVTWEALEDAGQIPEKLAGSHTGVFVGISCGNHRAMVANRISYHFDLHGPSLSIDTACSSSLVAVDLACRSLITGESSLALASGVNMLFSPAVSARFTQSGWIASDNRCRSFDAKADGYVQSEGIGVIVLKLLSQAQTDGDRIYAVIPGGAVNHNGLGNGLTVPNIQSQVALLQQAYKISGIDPATIHYVEAQGTATPIGDALEMKALGSVVGKGRSINKPCRVGCVKTNIGHTESSSGIAGLIKVALSLYNRQIPANLHCDQPNSLISWENLGLKVQQTLESLPEEIYPIRAGISAFGLGGTNAHIVLEEAPKKVKSLANFDSIPLQILTLTAKSRAALQDLVKGYQEFLNNQPAISLTDICFTNNVRRSQFNHRLSLIFESREQLETQLDAYLQGKSLPRVLTREVKLRKPAKICFIFTGNHSRFKQIIRLFYHQRPEWRSYLTECESILNAHLGKQFLEIIDVEYSDNSQLVNFLLEYALAQLWKFLGIEPAMTMGYGTGNYVALTVAGILTLEDTIALILGKKNIELIANFQPGKIPTFSHVTGEIIPALKTIHPTQWQQEFDLSTNYLSEFPQSLLDSQYILLDVCSNHIKNSDIGKTDEYDINRDHLYLLFLTLSKLWLMGVKVDWYRVTDYSQCHLVSLPAYAFQHQSYWINVESAASNDKKDSQFTPNSHKEFVSPRNEVEQKLANIWRKILGHESVSIHDNFFELGGNSRLSMLLVHEIEKTFNSNFSLATFFQFPTIEEIAQSIQESILESPKIEFSASLKAEDYQKLLIHVMGRPGLRPSQTSLMVSLRYSKNQIPIFFCANSIDEVSPMSKYLRQEESLYFLESGYTVFFQENRVTKENIKAIASHHLQDILTIQSEGEYILVGYSFGSLVVYELAKQLEELGKKVANLIIIDMPGNYFLYKYFDNILLGIILFFPNFISQIIKTILDKTIFEIYKAISFGIHEKFLNLLVNRNTFKKIQKYTMKGYGGKITLFLAKESPKYFRGQNLIHQLRYWLFPQYGWTKKEVYQVYHFPGSHFTMIQEPHVKTLVDTLVSCITQEKRFIQKVLLIPK